MYLCVRVWLCVLIKAGGWWEKRVTVVTPCAWCGAKPLASINLDTCVCACVRDRERESGNSRDGDVAGNASATVTGPQQPEPPLHCPRLSPPSYSPSISLSSPHLHSPPSIPPSETKTKAPVKLQQHDSEALVQTRLCYIAVHAIWAASILNWCTSRVSLNVAVLTVIIKSVACLSHYLE